MGFLSRLFGRRTVDESKAVEFSQGFMAALNGGWGVPTKSGQQVSTNSSLQVMAFYRGMVAIAEGVAQLPIEIYRTTKGGRGAEPATDHPLYDLLMHEPSAMQDGYQFWRTIIMHAVGAGNGVAYKNIVNGQVRELIPVRPECVAIDLHPTLYTRRYDLTFEVGTGVTVGQAEVFHLAGPSWAFHKGVDPTLIGREALGLAQATEEAHARLHSNGVRPSGVLEAEGKISQDVVDRLREQFRSKNAGASKSSETLVLSGGLKWKPTAQTGVDAEHLDTRKHQIEEIARLLGVFPIILGHAGDQSPTFASADAFLQAHVRFTLQPWFKAVRSAIETQLLTRDERNEGYRVRIDASELLRGSLEARTAYYKSALGTNSSPGWLSPNEVREDDGWNPMDGDDFERPLTPKDYATATAPAKEDAGQEQPKPPAEQPEQKSTVNVTVQTPESAPSAPIVVNMPRSGAKSIRVRREANGELVADVTEAVSE